MDEDQTALEASKKDPVEELSGYPEGTVLPNGEKIVGSYDSEGALIGWHKVPATEETE